MADTIEYKCPACGGTLEFDGKTQKLKCIYCGTEVDPEEFESQHGSGVSAGFDNGVNGDAAQSDSGTPSFGGTDESGTQWQSMSQDGWSPSEVEGMKVYSCQSCGAQIVAEESTGATQCPYCGNNVVMTGAFAGDLKPDFIIPFQKDKKAAKEAYMQHLEGKSFLPGIFRNENHIDEIKGVYVPFWLFSGDAQVNYNGVGRRIKTWRQGNTEYTATELWQVERQGEAAFEYVPVNASSKMDDALMESIEPYDTKDMVPFKKAYLSGYLADRYDVDRNVSCQTAYSRMKNSTMSELHNTMAGYAGMEREAHNIAIKNSKYWYVLYPVWILNTTWRGEHYIFAMNGQTGKLVGDLPADSGSFWKYVGTRGAVLAAIAAAVIGFFF